MTVTIEHATAWREAVQSTVERECEAAGVDPQSVLGDERFFESLNDLATVPADDELFVPQVESALSEYLAGRATEARTTESVVTDHIDSRVLEAKGTNAEGGRIFRVKLISTGTSRNGNRYTEAVLRDSARLYEGAKAYDRHRDAAELRSSTINGLVGGYRSVEATGDGLYADLHLLRGATHAAEALDASIEAQAAGLPPLIGLSHDVEATFKDVQASGRRVREATAIRKVNSIDLVADPSAGGVPVRVLAGGVNTEHEEEGDVTVTRESVLGALGTATDEQLAAVGLARTARTTEAAGAEDKGSVWGRMFIREKVKDADLPEAVIESITAQLPQRITEADVDSVIAGYKATLVGLERANLAPTVTTQVTKESRERKVEALDAFFQGDFTKGYKSFKQAWADWTGYRSNGLLDAGDINKRILQESWGGGYHSDSAAGRTTEALDSSSWAQVLGDSVTRRLVAEYKNPSLQVWRRVVSNIEPVMDFRTQRVARIGGYGELPTVLEGGPYNPLTSPGDEEATYALAKKGGTEEVTLEMIANDDRRRIATIPRKMGRAAAQTLYRFVMDMFANNVTCTYDSTAWFHSNHNNTDTSSALSQSTLSIGRRKMIEQSAYGDTSEILAVTPKYLLYPPELEELAFQLTKSAVAVPSSGSVSDMPNIHQANGLIPILVPYWTDANDWFLVADPDDIATIEVGFYQGREEPELFTQADPTSGSVWSNDVFQWKIRHIYNGTPLEHRSVYRGVG